MPTYAWTCSACGHANVAGAVACPACGCPAVADYRDMVSARERHERAGGAVLPGAAQFFDEEHRVAFAGALKVLTFPFLLFLWPSSSGISRLIDSKGPPGAD